MRAIEAVRGIARSWSSLQVAAVAALVLVCLGLAGIIAVEVSTPSLAVPEASSQQASAGHAKASTSAGPTPFSLPPLQSFASITDRPLFSQSRRPSPQGSNDSLGPWSSMVLAGIIISPASREALILHGKPPTVVHVQEGQDVDGWLVTSILPDRVVLRGGTTEHELKLLDKIDATAPKTPNFNLPRARPAP
jgi:general secretion pathway protein N